MTKVCILGATGSIGKQAIQVCKEAGFEVAAVSAHSSYQELFNICRDINPRHAALADEGAFDEFRNLNPACKMHRGMDGILEMISECGADIVLNSIVGSAGILPTMEAVKTAGRLALANKETLVAAGGPVMKSAADHGCEIIPVDSEHSAIFQCLSGNNHNKVSSIYLTASGGPFRGYGHKELEDVTPAMALRHPNWEMGAKITIDSATLMNKGLEVIEAHWLFSADYDNINVVVHPQSIVHSMVEFEDNSLLAQLGAPDMRVPIQYALTYPRRMKNDFKRLDPYSMGKLHFERPDTEAFRCLSLAYEAGRTGGTMPCVLNAANEEAVKMFLEGKIKFTQIADTVERVMGMHININKPDIGDILECDKWARTAACGG